MRWPKYNKDRQELIRHKSADNSEEAGEMKTDVDSCLKELARLFRKKAREGQELRASPEEVKAVMVKHCKDKAEMKEFYEFLTTPAGRMRFRTLLSEVFEAKNDG